jgi:hypothetical protein
MWGVHGKKMYGFIIALLDVEIKLKDRSEAWDESSKHGQ